MCELETKKSLISQVNVSSSTVINIVHSETYAVLPIKMHFASTRAFSRLS